MFAAMSGVDASSHTDPLVGQVLAGRFRIVRLLDRGGMGRVYEAVQEPLGRRCALKTLDLADPTGEFKQRFFNEARLCAQLSHPNTIRIFDYGSTADGVYFFAMEFLEGRTLRHAIKSDGPFTPRRAIHVFRQLCGAIGEAHAAGILHRDIKPANVFLCQHGEDSDFTKVLDFGLVKEMSVDAGLSTRNVVLGSPMYMAPEQIEALSVDPRTDVYALGLMLWCVLTARTPYRAVSTQALLAQQLMKEPPTFAEVMGDDHGIPASLERLVRYAIAKEPDQRLGSTRELAKGLVLVGRELDGRIPPVDFGLIDGVLQTPPGVVLGAEVLLPHPPAQVSVPEMPSGATLRSSGLPAAPVAALGAGMLLFGGGGLALGALVVMLTLGVMAFGLSGSGVESAPAPAPVVVPEPAVVVPSVHAVALSTDPEGADVYRGQALIGATPMVLKVPQGETWTLRLAKPGLMERTVELDGSTNDVTFRLDKQQVEPRRPAPVAPTPDPPPRSGLGREVRSPWDE
jgi:serine/threonine-protein kinase